MNKSFYLKLVLPCLRLRHRISHQGTTERFHSFQWISMVLRDAPLSQVRDAGNLLTRAGLMIPSVDVDEVTVNHGSLDDLVHHLRSVPPLTCTRLFHVFESCLSSPPLFLYYCSQFRSNILRRTRITHSLIALHWD